MYCVRSIRRTGIQSGHTARQGRRWATLVLSLNVAGIIDNGPRTTVPVTEATTPKQFQSKKFGVVGGSGNQLTTGPSAEQPTIFLLSTGSYRSPNISHIGSGSVRSSTTTSGFALRSVATDSQPLATTTDRQPLALAESTSCGVKDFQGPNSHEVRLLTLYLSDGYREIRTKALTPAPTLLE